MSLTNKPNGKGKRRPARDEDIAAVRKLPNLWAYIVRLDAVVTSFRKAVVQEKSESGYYRDVCEIEWEEGGKVTCTLPEYWQLKGEKIDVAEYAPTEDEAAAIAIELAGAKFPKAMGAKNTHALLAEELKLPTRDPSIFEFWSQDGGAVLFVQQRIDREDGDKTYLPWTFFDDGVWRRLEPEGKLPLFGLNTLKDATTVFLHEGAKAARYCQWLSGHGVEAAAARAKHPWAAELIGPGKVHLGWPGGATNPHRADFLPVKKLSARTDVVLVCDNDDVGKKAAKPISRELSRKLKQVLFDGRFKNGFDLADDFADPGNPGPLFEALPDGSSEYVGPSLADLTYPATWATRELPGAGKPAFVARDEFLAEWFWVNDADTFVSRADVHRRYNKDQFNNLVAPFAHVDNVARLVVKENNTHRDCFIYRPGAGRELTTPVMGTVRRAVNLWSGPSVKPVPDMDVKPLLDFFEYLFPVPDEREVMMNWAATLIAQPKEKMHFGLLLVGPQGCGKNTFGELIELGLGPQNVSWVEQNVLVDSDFNGHLAMKQLVICPEIYAGHSSKAYDRLKSVVTDPSLDINEKYQRPYRIENWAHVLACSNSERALKLTDEDRRWFVPKLTDLVWSPEVFRAFHEWKAKQGAVAVVSWAHERVKNPDNIIRAGQRPPETETKREMVRETWSPGMMLVRDALAKLKMDKGDQPIVIADKTLVLFVHHTIHGSRPSDRLEKPSTIRKVAKAEGWFVGDVRAKVKDWDAEVLNGRMICSTEELAAKTPGEMNAEGIKPVLYKELEALKLMS